MFWGTLADMKGRRPMFLCCLITLSLSCVGLALVPTSAYWLLVLLRCLQAAGSASTVALGEPVMLVRLDHIRTYADTSTAAGTVGDIATPAERGGFMGFSGVGTLLGPAIGPVIGGAWVFFIQS
jgi:MFS family permease